MLTRGHLKGKIVVEARKLSEAKLQFNSSSLEEVEYEGTLQVRYSNPAEQEKIERRVRELLAADSNNPSDQITIWTVK